MFVSLTLVISRHYKRKKKYIARLDKKPGLVSGANKCLFKCQTKTSQRNHNVFTTLTKHCAKCWVYLSPQFL